MVWLYIKEQSAHPTDDIINLTDSSLPLSPDSTVPFSSISFGSFGAIRRSGYKSATPTSTSVGVLTTRGSQESATWMWSGGLLKAVPQMIVFSGPLVAFPFIVR